MLAAEDPEKNQGRQREGFLNSVLQVHGDSRHHRHHETHGRTLCLYLPTTDELKPGMRQSVKFTIVDEG